jgi:23S rRNA pseudouridine1911/1915/1917 synthase
VNEPSIIYEDNHIIALNKPPGWLVQGDDTGDKPLSEWVKDYLKRKYCKPGAVYLGVLHRLDRPVSGVVLFARTSKAAARLSKMIQTRAIIKTYLCKVQGIPDKANAILEHYILRNETNNTVKAFLKEVSGSLYAKLEYSVTKQNKNESLLSIELYTGRHHQIRAQLSAIGHPIVGDLKYGYPTANKDHSISLHAYSLEFEHPVTKERIRICAEPPF